MKNPFHNFIIYPPELILEEYLKSCRKKNIVRLISVWKICSSGLQKVTVRRYSHILLVNSEIKFYIILQFRCQIKIICISSFLGFPFSFFNFQRFFFQNFLQWFQVFKINCGRSVTETLWQEYYLLIHIFHGKNISGERKKKEQHYTLSAKFRNKISNHYLSPTTHPYLYISSILVVNWSSV